MTAKKDNRYSRQTKLDGFGEIGQQKLADSHIVVVGVGGLGCAAATYLAAAGVGCLSLIDPDKVEVSNLHRQVLFTESDIGMNKVDAAFRRLKEINSNVSITTVANQFDPTMLKAAPSYPVPNGTNGINEAAPTLVLDCADTEAATLQANAYSLTNSIPLVTASVYKNEGRISAFSGIDGACYGCNTTDSQGLSCELVGTLGPTPGVLGTLQASFAIGIITSYQAPKFDQLNILDTATLTTTQFELPKNPVCSECSTSTSNASRLHSKSQTRTGTKVDIKQILPTDLKAKLDAGEVVQIVDVREPEEWEVGNLEGIGAIHIPMADVADRLSELNPDLETVIHCRSGGRSAKVVENLQEKGFQSIWNLDGGIHRWVDEVDSSITKC